MSVTSFSGGSFTVTVGSTEYTSQVTGGSVANSNDTWHVKTLDDAVDGSSGGTSAVQLDYLYDAEDGMHGALETAIAGLVPVDVTVVGGTGQWTGPMMCDTATVSFDAEGQPTGGSVSFSSSKILPYTAVTP